MWNLFCAKPILVQLMDNLGHGRGGQIAPRLAEWVPNIELGNAIIHILDTEVQIVQGHLLKTYHAIRTNVQ